MGVLIDGVWQEQEPEAAKADPAGASGRFERAQTAFRNWVTPDGRPGPTGSDGFSAAAGPLSSLRVARLPLGASHADHARAEGAGADHPGLGHALADGRAGLDVLAGRRRDPRSAVQQPLPARDLHARRRALHRPRHRAGAVGPAHPDHRQQRIVRDHPHVQQRIRCGGRAAGRLLSQGAARGDRCAERAYLRHRQQRRLQGRLRHHAGGLRGGGRAAVRDAGLAGGAARRSRASCATTR